MEIHSLSITHQPQNTEVHIQNKEDLKDISINSTVQLLVQLVKKPPVQADDWIQWVSHFQSLFVQCVCSNRCHALSLCKQFIPSLEAYLFLSSFVFFWFSLKSSQRVLLHNSFLSLTPLSIPHSIAIVFISMQMAIIDLDIKSTLFFDEKELPFRFDFIIHLCSMLHFDDSGLRLANMVLHSLHSDAFDVNGILKDCINMNNRSCIISFPVLSSYQLIREYSHTKYHLITKIIL